MIYVILNSDDVDEIDFTKVFETSIDTLRYNIPATKTFVKFRGETPSFLEGKTQYSHSEILSILSTSEWLVNPDPE